MGEKILFVASVSRHLRHFHTPFIQYLQSQGYEVHTAASGGNLVPGIDRHFEVEFERSPYSAKNMRAYRLLKRIIDENDYRLIHCHTPNASALARLAARASRKKGTQVAYTAHGFHFYRGAPAQYNLVYRNIERYLSRFTDYIITINREDYEAVAQYGFQCGKAFLTKGMGVDPDRFAPVSRETKMQMRGEAGIGENAFVLVYPAEYSFRKNQEMLFRAVAELKGELPDLLLLLPGDGPKEQEYRQLCAALRIGGCVRFLGYQQRLEHTLAVSDVNAASSRQEGLPTHMVESLSMGLPCIATDIRGHRDLIRGGVNGYLVPLNDYRAMAGYIRRLYDDRALCETLGQNAIETAGAYHIADTLAEHAAIYREMLGGGAGR
ncbi:MAG TPA: glycosyltransferase [Feifaniaceae bacterium]|nr:glycosyltransferase [Feifaniaceae bacterium]